MKLSVSNNVLVPVKFQLKDGLATKQFAFTLTCERLTTAEWEERITDPVLERHTNQKIRETMFGITTGWDKQTLVLDDDNVPAAFSDEALEVMFTASGVLDLVVASYVKESGARGKN